MKRKVVQSSLGIGSLVLLFAAMDTIPCGQSGSSIAPVPGLGGDGLQINAINAAGQLAGSSYLAGNAEIHALLFSSGSSTDLGVLDGFTSGGFAINASGQVAGDSDAPNWEIHAFLHDGTSMLDLGSLGGGFSSATALNDAGQVVGSSLDADFFMRAFLYSGGTMTNLGTLGGSSSSAVAINNHGNVAGNSAVGDFGSHAFFWTNGTMTDLGTLGGSSSTAFAMNANDVIVGDSELISGQLHGFVYSGGVMTDLGDLGGGASSAHAINNAGQVIGNSLNGSFEVRGFFYDGGPMVDLGTLGGTESSAFALNNLGQVVGDSLDSATNNRAFLWQNGTMVDLNTFLPTNSGWVLTSARLINDAGRVVGLGTLNDVSTVFVMDLGAGNNNAPVADAGTNQVVECGSQVTLDGSQSNDPDNDVLTFVWRDGDTVLGTGPVLATALAEGTHLITLTVTDPCEASDQASVVIQVLDSTAPVIQGSAPVEPGSANAQCQAAVPNVVPGISATDNCTPTGLLLISQDPAPGTFVGLGTHSIVVTVSDASGNSAQGTVDFVVADATAPTVVSAPSTVTVAANNACQGTVPNVVPDIVATDNCSAAGLTIAQSPAPGTVLGSGPHTITVTITDAAGNSATQQVTLLIKDTTAPVTNSLSVSPNLLSPPNHAIIPVTVSVSVTDNCDPNPVCKIISITANEAVDAGDITVTGDLTATLAASRNPSGTGRVYTITVECTDNSGNSSTGTVTVTVPKGNNGGGGRR